MPPEPFFSGPGLDRADLLRADPGRVRELAASSSAKELAWDGDVPAIGPDGALVWRPVGDPALFLGLEAGEPRFSALRPGIGDGRSALPLLPGLGAKDAPLFAAALSLASWHARHGFCASCGAPSDIVRAGWSRRCTACPAEHFPRVDPVVIMLAEHDGRLLLGRQYHYPERRYSALAGFVEVGESIEDAVARELHEEAGIEVADICYVASQPWPFPSSLMIGCTSRALGDALTVDYTENEQVRWFTRDEVAAAVAGDADAPFQAPPSHAIARTLLDHWLAAA
ncbi:MAG: NAD(+) diphosphatase [Sphingomicrobium sp.]